MLNIVLFGPPGAGKGTQSARLTKKYNLIHLSTGDILRGEISAGTELGKKAKLLMDEGILVPDEVVIGMIWNKINSNRDTEGFIFDGFPRTEAQAAALDNLLAEVNSGISCMLALEVPEQELINRLLERGKVSGRADDQNEEVIRKRLQVYEAETSVLKDYYRDQDKFESIKGTGNVEEVFDRLCDAINRYNKS